MKINHYLVSEIQKNIDHINGIEDMKNIIPFEEIKVTHDAAEVEKKLIKGLYFPLKQAHWTNFLPLFNHSAHQFAESAYHSLTTMLG